MQVRVTYFAQLKRAAGRAEHTLQLTQSLSLRQLGELLAEQDERLRPYFPAGSPAILAFVNGVSRSWSDLATLADGDQITLLTPMAGG